MTNPVEKIGIPESITINGVTHSVTEVPELQALIQAVSKVEKNKLYSQIESLKEQFKSLQGVQVEAPQIDYEQLAQKLEGKFITSEQLEEQFKNLRTDFPNMIKEVVQPVLSATERAQHDELEAYRNQLLEQNAATCIPDLVKGNTKEELDAALQESIRIRSTYPSPVGQPAREAVPPVNPQPGVQTPTPAPAAPKAPQMPAAPKREAPSAEQGGPDVKHMSMAEFASKRDAMKASLENLYGGQAAL